MIDTSTQATGLGNACAGFAEGELDELRAIATLHDNASGLLMRLLDRAGGRAESLLSKLPAGAQAQIASATELALRASYDLAFSSQSGGEDSSGIAARARSWASGERWHLAATAVTGALGGAGGLATTLIDLPVTTTLILRSIQQVAAAHGEDLARPEVRAECIAVLGLGGPLEGDDDAELGLFAARMALTGKTVAATLAAVLPRFGVTVSQKVLAQAVPVIGAIAGATINPVFTGYYQTMAQVHFRLRRLERAHPPEQVRACFERIAQSRRKSDARASAPR